MSAAEITVGADADTRASDYSFTRQQQDWLYEPLEQPLAPFFDLTDWIAGGVLLVCFVAAFVVPTFLVAATH